MLVDLTKEKPKEDLKEGITTLAEFLKDFPKETPLGAEIAKVLAEANSTIFFFYPFLRPSVIITVLWFLHSLQPHSFLRPKIWPSKCIR